MSKPADLDDLANIGTILMGIGHVDAGIALESLLLELARFRSTAAVCPHCATIMQRTKYDGYYDEFEYWDCACADGVAQIVTRWKGEYA